MKKKRVYAKPPPLYHLTTRGRVHIAATLLKLLFKEQLYIWMLYLKKTTYLFKRILCVNYNNFSDHIRSVSGILRFQNTILQFISRNTPVRHIFYQTRLMIYVMMSAKIATSAQSTNGITSVASEFCIGMIIFCGLVLIMEPKPVAAAKMSPQMRAYRKNMQEKRKRAEESPQEKADRQAKQRARAEANKESNNKRRRLNRSKDTSDESDETQRMSDRIRKQQERDKSRRRKNFSDRIKLLMFYAARAIQVTNTDLTGKTNREHRSHVCLVCDCFLMGAYPNGVPSMSVEEVRQHRERLSVRKYEEYYNITLKESLKQEYTVPGFEGMLLSRRSRKVARGRYAVCKDCKSSMKPKHVNRKTPPKFSIANGNAIGTFPTCIPCCSPGKEGQHRNIKEDDLSPVLKAFMSPVRPFGYVFQHNGGKQKCISGHYQFFETDQNCITGALNYIDKNIANNVFVMICGATTPRQDKTIRTKTSVDIELYKDIRSWFVENSSCRAFRDEPMPNNVDELAPCIIRDSTNQSGKDEEVDPVLENTFGGVTYAFSSAQDPLEESSVFQSSKKFACAMVKQTNPVLLLHGGNHAREHEVDLEAVLPFAFPYGMGGPNQKRPCHISKKQIIKRYTRLAMPQFMTAEVILILHHIFSRQISFDTGIMTCRKKHGSTDFTRQINSLKASDFEERQDGSDPRSDHRVNSIVNSITTSCKSLGHTAEAAGAARQRQFAMMDYFGLNSLFLTITPDDECNFRVRLFADPDNAVSITSSNNTPVSGKVCFENTVLQLSHVSCCRIIPTESFSA